MVDIRVPALGESVAEALVGSWKKAPGDRIERDEVVVELETDKVSVEVSALEAGVLAEILVSEGETVEVGAVLGRIGSGVESSVGREEKPAPSQSKRVEERSPPAAQPRGSDTTMDIKVPAMGESVTEGTLANWLVKPGQQVSQDDPVAEIETDKVAIEVPAPSAGTISELVVQEGETVEIGTIIARLGEGGAAAPSAPAASPPPPPQPAPPAAPEPAASNGGGSASPAVRRVAAEGGVNPSDIPGTGRDGRVTKADALRYVQDGGAPAAAPAPARAEAPPPREPRSLGPREERVRMTRLRQTIARRLKEAQDTAAMLTTFNDVDMSAVMQMRKDYKEVFEKKHGVRLGFMSFFVKSCVAALKEIPNVNAEIDGTDIIYKNYYNVGVAVGTDKGLVVPVVRDADTMTLAEIEADIARLGEMARDGKLSMDDLQGGTFTISNGGVYGSLMSTPILNPPQSGVLGMHRIEQRAVVIDGKVEVRPMMYLALSYDHRIVDGKEAVTFLVRVKEALEDPERMLLDV